MKHTVFQFIILISLLTANSQSQAQSNDFRIGVILPLTGKAASIGNSIKNGMEIALEGLPQQTRSHLIVDIEDDGSDPKNAMSALEFLTSKKNIDLVISSVANTGRAIVPITERKKLPMISLSFDREISNGKLEAFTFFVSADELARVAGAKIKSLGYKNIALVTTQHDGNLAQRTALMKVLDPATNYTMNEEIQLSDNEYLTSVTKLRAATKTEAVAALMHPAHLGTFVKELRRAGIKLPVFTLGGFEDSGVRASADGELTGQWYSAAEYKIDFLLSYRSRFPESSPYGAAYGHDVILLLAQAVERKITPSEMPEFLRHASISNGVLKSAIADGKNGFDIPATIRTVGEDY